MARWLADRTGPLDVELPERRHGTRSEHSAIVGSGRRSAAYRDMSQDTRVRRRERCRACRTRAAEPALTPVRRSSALAAGRRFLTVKSSISLTDEQHVFARAPVEAGRYSSLSAVLERGTCPMRQAASLRRTHARHWLPPVPGLLRHPTKSVCGTVRSISVEDPMTDREKRQPN